MDADAIALTIAVVRKELTRVQTKGDPGADGSDGKDGADGLTPTHEQLADLVTEYIIRNPIRDGLDGRDGKDGKDGVRGLKGDKGDKGEPGQDAKITERDIVRGVSRYFIENPLPKPKNGRDGRDGRDGGQVALIGPSAPRIQSATLNADNSLTFTFTDGSKVTTNVPTSGGSTTQVFVQDTIPVSAVAAILFRTNQYADSTIADLYVAQ